MQDQKKAPSMTLEERIYRTPVVHVIGICATAAVALFLILTLVFFICGGCILTDNGGDVTTRYFGIMKGDVPTLGVFRSTDGSGGRINGDRVKFKDGSNYEGGLYYLDFSGSGVFTDKDGNIYSGVFRNGKLEGQGSIKYADGSAFTGNFSLGLADGYGEMTSADGSSYKGYFKSGEKSGKGTLIYADGSVYTGDFERDMRHGEGKYRFASGDTYTGEFRNNVITGYGTYFFYASGRVFTGEFVAGVPQIN